ncbi:hypothetical protein [Acetomicrobium sp.]|uniref:hypothetical protein n=1 Tax=Acetomicrobium sp. TaxID=1872099 RepID=UPI0028729656|nr:hypothetical protein [Acetomicrobium sp.]MDR9770408.1 hypothetical protein [Acetomicrobium sp.]
MTQIPYFPLDGLDPNMPALVNVEVGGKVTPLSFIATKWAAFPAALGMWMP